MLAVSKIREQRPGWFPHVQWHQVDRGQIYGAVSDHCNPQTLRWSASNLLNNELHRCCCSNISVSSPWARHYMKGLKTLHWAPLPVCLLIIMSHPCACDKISRPSHSILSTQKLNCGEGLGTRLKTAFVWLTFLLNAHQITNQVNWKCPLTHQQLYACCTCSQNFIASLKSFQAEKQNFK